MIHIEIKHSETGETEVHYDGPNPEFTLCGDAIEVDEHAAMIEPRVTKRKVDCERCRAVARHVRGR